MLKFFDRNTHIAILYRDEHLVAVHKPSGLVVHPTDLARAEKISLMGLVRRMMRQRVWPIHRLDRPTSGIVLFALNREAARLLGGQLQNREVGKRYLAVVRGFPSDQLINYPLKERPLYRNDQVCSEPQAATTGVRCLDQVELPEAVGRYPTSRYALVELLPTTGRRHQLRRHMKHIFHPIIGDTTYGDSAHNRFFRSRFDCDRLLLAAVELTIRHPATGQSLTLQAPPEASFCTVLSQLGFAGGESDSVLLSPGGSL